MTFAEGALLVGAAALGGALNAVAGGGSFFTFPALVLAGVPAIPANATSTLALWPGSLASAAAYRRELAGERRRILPFGLASLAGGVAGAWILVRTPPRAFDVVVPFLMLIATVLFAFGPRITRRLWERSGRTSGPGSPLTGALVQLAIAIYGGYFGGGMGMMMLAAYSLLGMDDIHRMNGLKTLLAVAINGVALATFVVAGVIHWHEGLVMTAGAMAGGYGAAAIARRLDPKRVRAFVTVVGVVITAIFFVRAFGPSR
ncbi:MAG: sulfite exporter TauE/SafE family protein [Myxococcaceae bacterium]|nr:sulfite exporter TauE/SafE family protein [Myxococcaceae bacterium]